jgi:cytochrome P450
METSAAGEVDAFAARVGEQWTAAHPWVHLDALQPFQRIALRSTFTYLTGQAPEAAGVTHAAEQTHLAASAVLRAALPARARSIWVVAPDWVYGTFTQLGRSERRARRGAHALARLAMAAAVPGSPLHGVMGCSRRSHTDDLHAAATLLFAGHDTQGATLAWCALRLGHDVAWQARLRSALAAKSCGRHCVESAPAVPACAGGPSEWPADAMLDATIKETLRLHPPAPLVVRALHGGYVPPDALAGVIRDSRFHVPAGAAIAVWLHSVHRDTACWGADADAFLPTRWLAQTPASGSHGESFMPFAVGARTCPGAALATASLRVALATLVSRLEWTLDGGADGEKQTQGAVDAEQRVLHPSVGFTVTPAHGVRLRMRPVT